MNQAKYIKELSKKFNMENAKPTKTLMSTSTKLDANDGGNKVDVTLFKGMIGNLLYLTTGKVDIIFSVCMCARFQPNHKQSHLIIVKRILRCLISTQKLSL